MFHVSWLLRHLRRSYVYHHALFCDILPRSSSNFSRARRTFTFNAPDSEKYNLFEWKFEKGWNR